VAKRSGKALGITVGIIILLVYHKLLEFGLSFAATGAISHWVSIWLPTAVLILLTARLYYIGAYKVGGTPLRQLEIIYEVIIESFAKLARRLSTSS